MKNQQSLQNLIHEVDAVLVLAGAGMSADSGLQTFSQASKDWKKNYQTFMTRHAFEVDKENAWAFYENMYKKYIYESKPHQGYLDLLNQLKDKDYFIVTSNIDLLFEKAEFDLDRIHHVHGRIDKLQCKQPCNNHLYVYSNTLRYCSRCGRSLRPNIFLFDDALERRIIGNTASMFLKWCTNIDGLKTLILEIGVGSEGLHSHSISYAKKLNAKHILINPYPPIFSKQSKAKVYKLKAVDMLKTKSHKDK